jgi:hypothetical protein
VAPAPVHDLHEGLLPGQVTSTTGGSASTVPPHWTARWQKTLVVSVLAVGMIVVGFTSARFVPRRGHPAPPPAQPLPPVVALEPVPVVALRPAAQSAAAANNPELDGRASEGPPELSTDFQPSPSPSPNPNQDRPVRGDQTEMLIEWARRATSGGRYVSPPGDNLVELLKRIEAVAPDSSDVLLLREQAAAAINKKARELLHHRRTLAALDSYRALLALAPEAPFPRSELAVQLAATARVIHRNHDQAIELARDAVQLAPKLAVTHLALGDALLAKGQRGAAATEYRRALALFPAASEHRQALRGLARASHSPTPASGTGGRHHASLKP